MTQRNYFILLAIVAALVVAGIAALYVQRHRAAEGPGAVNPNAVSTNDAYARAYAEARTWQPDAQLVHLVTPVAASVDPQGGSERWEALFVSPSRPHYGYVVALDRDTVIDAHEISYTGAGAPLPSTLIPVADAIISFHAIPGYGQEIPTGVELLYDSIGRRWYWGIHTAKGVTTISATQ